MNFVVDEVTIRLLVYYIKSITSDASYAYHSRFCSLINAYCKNSVHKSYMCDIS